MKKDKALETVYNSILGDHSILLQLRNGDGLDEALYGELVAAMKLLIEEYKGQDVVPKKLALSFVDISNYFYFNEGKYSEEYQDRLEDAVHEISQLANELFKS
jgi:hypothetical protein